LLLFANIELSYNKIDALENWINNLHVKWWVKKRIRIVIWVKKIFELNICLTFLSYSFLSALTKYFLHGIPKYWTKEKPEEQDYSSAKVNQCWVSP
jgi:hypothetical protein